MSWAAGVFSRIISGGWATDKSTYPTITTSRHDTNDDDLATGINACLTKDGSNVPTAALPMGGLTHTGVGNATARNHYAAAGQAQDSSLLWGGVAGGSANTYTITLTPAITAYAAGQKFAFKVDAAKGATGASTLNVNSVGAKGIKRDTTPDALNSGDMPAGWIAEVVYDGTQFILLNPAQVVGVNIAANAVTGAKIRLANNTPLRWRDVAGSSDINVLIATSNDDIEIAAPNDRAISILPDGGSAGFQFGSTAVIPTVSGGKNLGLAGYMFDYACLKSGIYLDMHAVSAAATPTALTQKGFHIITSTNDAHGVKLPAAARGDIHILVNISAANVCRIYPNAATDYVNGVQFSAFGGYLVSGVAGAIIMWAYDTNKWAQITNS